MVKIQVESKWSAETMRSDSVSKKDLISFLQESSSFAFQKEHKLNGKLDNVAKQKSKDQLIALYETLFTTEQFKDPDEVIQVVAPVSVSATLPKEKKVDAPVAEPVIPLYTKTVLTKGKGRQANKGDKISCWYTGMTASDNKIFDSNVTGKNKQKKPLQFKLGAGLVIRGWDEALQTMHVGEKAHIHIQSEWAYGKKGLSEAGIAPNSDLIFEVELVAADD